jgi:hypothetical protein
MAESVSTLNAWQNFYVIVGSAGAALTGLMFVVVTLISEASTDASEEGVSAFATPNVVHFCAALLVSAILTAPWTAVWQAAWALAIEGFGGLLYLAVALGRARHQKNYDPVFEDWLWHFVLPFGAYGTLAGAGLIAAVHATGALFAIALATTLLLFAGIHNAWDTVTYMALARMRARQKKKELQAAESARAAKEQPAANRSE